MDPATDNSSWLVDVWEDNFRQEMKRIEGLIDQYPFLGMVRYNIYLIFFSYKKLKCILFFLIGYRISRGSNIHRQA